MPAPGLKIYLRPQMTLTFDLLTPKIDRFIHAHAPWTTCVNLHRDQFTHFLNIVFTSPRTDNQRTQCLRRPVWPG